MRWPEPVAATAAGFGSPHNPRRRCARCPTPERRCLIPAQHPRIPAAEWSPVLFPVSGVLCLVTYPLAHQTQDYGTGPKTKDARHMGPA
jgi:hypothetical protein